MEKAIRVVSIEKGYDPRDFALVAFGGAGGLHACELAASLSIPTVIVPAMPGALSAYGILVSDIVKDYSCTVLGKCGAKSGVPLSWQSQLQKEFRMLERAAHSDFKQEGWKGTVELVRTADLRYRGQGFELNVPFTPKIIQAFHTEHKRRYGYSSPEREVEIVTIRLRARIRGSVVRPSRERRVGKRKSEPGVIARESLQPGKTCHGPAVITEYSATTVVPGGASLTIDRVGNLVISLTKPTRT
jgi:N-methylhydantoinase A